MNIAFVSTHLPSTYLGGAEILTEMMAYEFARHNHKITIFTGGSKGSIVRNGVTIKSFPELTPKPFRTLFAPLINKRIKKIFINDIDFVQADIVHAVDVDTLTMLLLWKDITYKLLATIQDYAMISPVDDLKFNSQHGLQFFIYSNTVSQIRKFIRTHALKNLMFAISVSNYVNGKLLEVAPHIHSTVIGNSLTTDWFKYADTERDIDVLYVGRLEKYKGVDILLEAVLHLSIDKKINVYIIGGGNIDRYRQKILELKLEHIVTILNEVPHQKIKQYYSRAKILIAPSIWPEPCGRTIIEGMASGCAVIATETGGTPESLIHNIHGLLVPPSDHVHLSKAIEYFLKNPKQAKKMGIAARQYAKKTYTLTPMAKRYIEFYNLIRSSR